MPCARPATITAHSNEKYEKKNERKGEKKPHWARMNPYALVWTRTEYNIIIFLWLQLSDYFLINCNRTNWQQPAKKNSTIINNSEYVA